MEKPFKTPLYPFTPISGFIMSITLLVFPILLGKRSAVDALFSGVGLTALALTAYYLRMVGRYRLQIAIGGVGIGIGFSLMLLTYFGEAGIMSPIFPYIPSYIMFLVSAISIVAGVLNITRHG